MSLLIPLYETGLLKSPQIILLRLLTADHSGVTPGGIGITTKLPKTTVSMALEQLERNGLVERRIVARNQKFHRIYLTLKGRKATEAMLTALVNYSDDVKKREGRADP